jgi:hypothetical protein
MLLRPAMRNCGRNISPLFKIAAAKFQDAKFRVLPHSGSGNGPLPLLRMQLRPLPPLFITLAASAKPADSAMSTEVAPGNSAYIYNSRNRMLLAIYVSDENAN